MKQQEKEQGDCDLPDKPPKADKANFPDRDYDISSDDRRNLQAAIRTSGMVEKREILDRKHWRWLRALSANWLRGGFINDTNWLIFVAKVVLQQGRPYDDDDDDDDKTAEQGEFVFDFFVALLLVALVRQYPGKCEVPPTSDRKKSWQSDFPVEKLARGFLRRGLIQRRQGGEVVSLCDIDERDEEMITQLVETHLRTLACQTFPTRKNRKCGLPSAYCGMYNLLHSDLSHLVDFLAPFVTAVSHGPFDKVHHGAHIRPAEFDEDLPIITAQVKPHTLRTLWPKWQTVAWNKTDKTLVHGEQSWHVEERTESDSVAAAEDTPTRNVVVKCDLVKYKRGVKRPVAVSCGIKVCLQQWYVGFNESVPRFRLSCIGHSELNLPNDDHWGDICSMRDDVAEEEGIQEIAQARFDEYFVESSDEFYNRIKILVIHNNGVNVTHALKNARETFHESLDSRLAAARQR